VFLHLNILLNWAAIYYPSDGIIYHQPASLPTKCQLLQPTVITLELELKWFQVALQKYLTVPCLPITGSSYIKEGCLLENWWLVLSVLAEESLKHTEYIMLCAWSQLH
jgi:hypothetical protein